MNDTRQGWSEYWERESAGGEVFVDGQGRKHPALREFWMAIFADVIAGSRVIDLASGAGSIYGHLPAGHGLSLWAADISPQALEALEQRIPGVTTLVCPADAVPVDDRGFDLVVSQFGIEYAGAGAFDEAARLVAPGGLFTALVHRRDGYIDSRNKTELREAQLVLDNNFIDRCLKLVDTAFSGQAEKLREAETAVVPAVRELEAAVQRCGRGVHAYLLAGFRELYEQRAEYDRADIDSWLEGMRAEVDNTVMRLAHMRSAALTADDVDTIGARLRAAGLVDVDVQEFHTPGNEKAVAWSIRARRPGS